MSSRDALPNALTTGRNRSVVPGATLALLQGVPPVGARLWITSTFAAIGFLLVTAIFGAVALRLGRRMRWLSAGAALRLRRGGRIAFGLLLVAAVMLPYLIAHAPWVGAGFGLALLVLVGGAVARETSPDSNSTDPDATVPPRH